MNLEVPNHGYAETGDVEALHQLSEREAVKSLAIRGLGGFDLGNQRRGIVLGAQRRHAQAGGEQR